ncbi:MAG: hypothetical protein ACODAB_04620 [Gemmatimonadota bacterium]
MLRPTFFILFALTASTSLTGCAADREADAQMAPTAAADKIADAMRAAPPVVARHATIMDETADGSPQVLRAGSNGWICTPSSDAEIEAGRPSPSCVDEQARAWFDARSARQTPRLEAVGFSYKLLGDNGASNVDPYADGPTPDNDWVTTGPHIIIFVPDVADIAHLPSDPASGGPYVMWQDTPYAHLMVPVGPAPTDPPRER